MRLLIKKFKSKVLIFFVLFSSYTSLSGNLDSHKYLANITQEINSNNTLIAFDLHDVIFKKLYKKIAYKTMLLIPKGMYRSIFNPFFWHKAVTLYNKKIIWEDLFYRLVSHYPYLDSLKNDFFEISNSLELIDQTVEIIKELKNKNYKIFLLSNIGKDTYDRLSGDYKETFELFDWIFVPSPENQYINKPQEIFYIEFKKYLANLNLKDKKIIFIDDLEENLISAYKFGISGVLFTSPKELNDVLKGLEVF